MRLLLGLALLSCSEPAVQSPATPLPGPVEDSSADKALGASAFSSLGMARIPSGVVQLGPRHGPPVEHAPQVHSPSEFIAMPPKNIEPKPWISLGGRGLMPRAARVDTFLIDQTEVTQAAYAEFLQKTGYRLPHVAEAWADDDWNWSEAAAQTGKSEHPVVMVSFHDASAYCSWRNKRLPTEAEWQLAALGPRDEQRTFPWGSRYQGDKLNHGRMTEPNFDDSDGHARTAPVGSYPEGRSPYGLDDTFGNAWEYTADLRIEDWTWARHDGFGPSGEMINARVPGPGLMVAVRGGSYYFDFRPNPGGEWGAFVPESRRKSAGFRCAADLPRQ